MGGNRANGFVESVPGTGYVRILTSMAVGVVVGAGVGWGGSRLLGPTVPPGAGTALGAAVGGGILTVTYLFVRTDDEEGVETVTAPAESDRSTGGPAGGDDLFDAHPDPTLYFSGEEGDVRALAANPSFEETFGTAAETVTETPLGAVTMTDELDGIADELAAGTTVDETVTCETVAGDSTFRVRTVRLSDDRPQGFLLYTPVGTMDAMGDRESDRVEELARVVSHELRNPLDSARTRVETAHDTGNLEHLETALDNLDRISRIISDLTTLAREGRLVGTRETVELAATVEEAWSTIDADGATLAIEEGLGRVDADDSALEHLFENLLRNAVEHGSVTSGPGDGDGNGSGEITVSVRVGPLEEGFYVEDDGPGIPPEERERVFEAGYTTTRDGTGLGLRIVERVAEAHGWSVEVTDGSDDGARFEITGVGSAE